LLTNLPNPISKLQHAPLPLEVLRARECDPTFFLSVVFTFGFTIESIKELGDELVKAQHSLPKQNMQQINLANV
jgi:hypothetical protein